MSEDRPDETEAERADRNFGDLLQELRVAQTGVQILFAFLLTIPMQARFPELSTYQKDVFIVALICTALSTAFMIAPVAYHRVLFRQRMKDHIVKMAARYFAAGLVFLGLSVIVAVHLVLDLVLNVQVAWVVAGLLGALLVLLWWVLPTANKRRSLRED